LFAIAITLGRGRDDLHDTETFVLELLEEPGQRGDGRRMDVVKKQNAFASRFESPHRQSNDLLATDAVMPIVGVSVGGKYGQLTRREFAFDDIGPGQARNAEERGEIFGIAQ
jgi:hypothetical protein